MMSNFNTSGLVNCSAECIYNGDSYDVTFTASDGYKFKSAPIVRDAAYEVFELSDDWTDNYVIAHIYNLPTNELVAIATMVSLDWEPELEDFDSSQLVNCKAIASWNQDSEDFTIIFTANDGYKFSSAPRVNDADGNPYEVSTDWTVDYKVANIYNINESGLTAIAFVIVDTNFKYRMVYKVYDELSGLEIEHDDDKERYSDDYLQWSPNTKKVLDFWNDRFDSYFTIINAGTIKPCIDMSKAVGVEDSIFTYYHNPYIIDEPNIFRFENYNGDYDADKNLYINGDVELVIYHKTPTVRYVTNNLTGCSTDNNLESVNNGESYSANISSDVGYSFSEDYEPNITMGGLSIQSSQLENGIVKISIEEVTGDIVITCVAIPDEPTEVNNADYGFINIYNPTLSELQRISSKWFADLSTGVTEQISTLIIGMFQIFGQPLTLANRQSVKLGKYDTLVGCKVVRESVIEVDCGTIIINEKYNSALDYDQYVNARVWLPFCGFFDISSDLFMNSEMNLKYKIDVLTGKCNAQLSSSRLDDAGVIYNFYGSAMMKIPYFVNVQEQSANGAINNDVYNISERTPYVLITRKINVTPNSSQLDGKPASEYVRLGDLTGFTKCKEVTVNGMISTKAEKAEIESLLKKGVIL